MNQCVPSWDNLDQDNSSFPRFNFEGHPPSNSANPLPISVPSLDYEVAELTWENGQLATHGLGPPRLVNKPPPPESFPKYGGAWDRPASAGDTLESLVDQATRLQPPHSSDDLAPWFDYHRAGATIGGVGMDALVPCDNSNNNNNNKGNNTGGGGKENCEESTHVPGIGSCSGAGHFVGAGIGGGGSCCRTNGCASESATWGRGEYSCQAATTTFDTELGGAAVAGGFTTSPSMVSAENTVSATAGKEYTKTSGEDHGSASRRRSQRESTGNDGRKKKGSSGKSSISTKRIRAAAIHNQSERKRRDRINERMRTLQKLVPNSSKADKASMLDEAIEYLKQMQLQVQLMSRMVPLALQQQQLQMSMMAPMGMGMGMGMGVGVGVGVGVGMGSPHIPPFIPLHPLWDNLTDRLPSMPPDPLLPFLACQSQPMNMEAYNRLAALFQQFQNSGGSNAGSSFKY